MRANWLQGLDILNEDENKLGEDNAITIWATRIRSIMYIVGDNWYDSLTKEFAHNRGE